MQLHLQTTSLAGLGTLVSQDGRNRTPYSGVFQSGLHFLISFF